MAASSAFDGLLGARGVTRRDRRRRNSSFPTFSHGKCGHFARLTSEIRDRLYRSTLPLVDASPRTDVAVTPSVRGADILPSVSLSRAAWYSARSRCPHRTRPRSLRREGAGPGVTRKLVGHPSRTRRANHRGELLRVAAAEFAIAVSLSLFNPDTPTAPTTSPFTRIGMPPRSATMSAVTNAVRP